jgi:chitodextrinase
VSALSGKVDVPVVGSVDKKVLIGVGGVAAAFVAWKWWLASAGGAAEYAPEDPGFEGGEVLPPVSGAVSPDNSYGLPGDDEPESLDNYGFRGTTNSQWTQYAATQLSQSERWGYTDIIVALGKYLAGAPLDSVQVAIVQAAIAVAGRPPVGNHPIITVPTTPVKLPAPANLRASNLKHDYVVLDWNSVSGASKYVVRRNGTQIELSGDTQMGVKGLSPSTSYTFTVNAQGLDGTEGEPATLAVTTKAKPNDGYEPTKPPTTKPPTTKPPTKRYRTMRITKRGQTLSDLVAAYNRQYKTNHSWQYIWNYNLQNRSPATAATLRKRGPNKVFIGSSFWFPY